MAVLLLCMCPTVAATKMMDGYYLEGVTTMARGGWNLKAYLEFASTAKPVTITQALTNSGGNITVKVDSIRLPIEIRYGLSDGIEVGGDFGFESDDGEPDGAAVYFDGSGLQRMRFFGKWNFWNEVAVMADLAFLGDNELYYSLDSFDLGMKFIYGPQLGAGTLNLNLGFLIKGGESNFGGGNSKITASSMDYKGLVFGYGIGYVYPYSDRFNGVFELAGGSSPLKGGGGVTTKPPLSILLGGRYGFTEMFNLDAAFGIGISGGSPRFLLKVGMDWQWGAPSDYSYSEPSTGWTPRKEPEQPKGASTTEKPKTSIYDKPQPEMETSGPEKAQPYESPAQYEPPKPSTPPAPPAPSAEDQLKIRVTDAAAAFNRGDYVTAVSQYEAAVKLKEGDATLHYNLGTAYFQLKKYAEAKTSYKNAVTLNPNDPDNHLYLGYAHYYLQDQPSAIREWQKVLELTPDNTLAKENLKALGVAE